MGRGERHSWGRDAPMKIADPGASSASRKALLGQYLRVATTMPARLAKALFHQLLAILPRAQRIALYYFRVHGYWPHVRHPRAFNEWVHHRKLYERDDWFVVYSDKIRAKEIVRDVLGPEWVTPTLWSGRELPQHPEWPVPFVIKANRGSGWNIFVRTEEDLKDWSQTRERCRSWLLTPWYAYAGEWFYDRIQPQIFVEPLIGDARESLTDYKFGVFGGKIGYIHADIGRNANHRRAFYNLNWKKQSFTVGGTPLAPDIPPPAHLREMISAAERLASPFSFVRIDMYSLPEGPKFGEFTFLPGAGYDKYNPTSIDFELGKLWERAVATSFRPIPKTNT